MLLKAEQSLLLLIDLQARLAPAIHGFDAVLRHNLWLVEVARRLSLPIAATVQYPAGLGPMVPELAALVPSEKVVEKIHFSAVADGCLEALAEFSRLRSC
jgi:nicotinamidase-related amidase